MSREEERETRNGIVVTVCVFKLRTGCRLNVLNLLNDIEGVSKNCPDELSKCNCIQLVPQLDKPLIWNASVILVQTRRNKFGKK